MVGLDQCIRIAFRIARWGWSSVSSPRLRFTCLQYAACAFFYCVLRGRASVVEVFFFCGGVVAAGGGQKSSVGKLFL